MKEALGTLFAGKSEEGGPGGVPPALPGGVRVYAIGDIHGQLHLLRDLIDQIDEHVAASPAGQIVEVCLGDYVDRGPDSAGVIDFLCARAEKQSREHVFIRGNHEIYLREFLLNPSVLERWWPNGAAATLASYGVDPRMGADNADAVHAAFVESFPQRHRDFLERLAWMHRIGDVVFTHAGIRPGVPVEQQTPEDLSLIRGDFLNYSGALPVRVVHGHTPMREPEVTPYRVSVDTGAFATGRLTCAVMEGAGVDFLATGR